MTGKEHLTADIGASPPHDQQGSILVGKWSESSTAAYLCQHLLGAAPQQARKAPR
jgi:hypothetical protein